MDITWNSKEDRKFVTNIGLITSRGIKGDDIMAAEWTHEISYSPGLLMVNVGKGRTTNKNIKKSKEFGVNLAAFDQNVMASIAGNNPGFEIDKISVLKELGFKFFPAKKIKALMVEGAALQAECKLIKTLEIGSHTTFIGEIVNLYPANDKKPLTYHDKKFWITETQLHKPSEEELKKIDLLIEKYRR